MDHIHNETVLMFLREHKDNPRIREFLKQQDKEIAETNEAFDENYKNYLDYLEMNIGDDASFTMDELKDLLEPRFNASLNKNE